MTSTPATDSVVRISAEVTDSSLAAAAEETTWTVHEVGTTGRAAIEPIVALTRGGRTAIYTQCTPSRLDTIASVCLDGEIDGVGPRTVVHHESEPTEFPVDDSLPGVSGVLGGCGWRRPTSVSDHEDAGGFSDQGRDKLFELGSELRGRGWGDASHDQPVKAAWERANDAKGEPMLVVNGHGTAADTLLLESAPFEVLDGANALAAAIDASQIVLYLSEADEDTLAVVANAVEQYPDPSVPMTPVAGKDVYRAGEPTMAIEDIEGNHRLEARRRPPGPETFGVDGRPTLVHTPRTFAHLAVGLRDKLPETRVVSIEGAVTDRQTVEFPERKTLEEAVGSVDIEGELKAVCVGGRFGGLTADLDTQLDPDSLAHAGLGTEGVIRVLSNDQCLLSFVGKRAAFASDANCGRCVPCREGTTQLAELLRDVYAGRYDRGKIAELADVMERTSLCEFGVAAARPVQTALDRFEHEIEAHADGQCPAGDCPEPLEAQ